MNGIHSLRLPTDMTSLQWDDAIIHEAIKRMTSRARKSDTLFNSPLVASQYFRLLIGDKEREHFVVAMLDAQNRLIETECLFQGTLSQTSVYPREVVKIVLQHNAANVMFAHNHPSGYAEPSNADKQLTTALANALALVDVHVLDHFVVTPDNAHSMVASGWSNIR
jgi:DNA repair protein RadC